MVPSYLEPSVSYSWDPEYCMKWAIGFLNFRAETAHGLPISTVHTSNIELL